jgi:AraC-like DNA-binding protein
MTDDIFLNNDALQFVPGLPHLYKGYRLPNADVKYASGHWGTICIQEFRGDHFLLRHFIFQLNRMMRFETRERGEGLQSLIGLKGKLDYTLKGLPNLSIHEDRFHLLNAHEQEGVIHMNEVKHCSIFNAYYHPESYEKLLGYFPHFKKELKKAEKRLFIFTTKTAPVRYSIHDAIQAIWLDRYLPVVQKKYIELRIQTILLSLLADTYAPPLHAPPNAIEQDKAAAARELILDNIRKHLTAEDIALQLHCSTSWLKKAFSKVFGAGMFHYLRKHRMQKAKEMLLQGESLKAVAIEVGMKPRNFPKEFKSYFGYTVTELKKGIRS